ncbi:MAG: hypothetical protein R2762_04500 [Bryobacteraceae bacterium]
MQRRRREVNIFNVSLLDILCGALGAFCFLMIVLLPYWRPPGANARDLERQYQEAMRELQDLRRKISQMPDGPSLSRQLEKMLDDMRKRQRQLMDSVNKLEQAKRDLKKSEDRANQLEMRRPMVVNLLWSSRGHNVDLYLRSRYKGPKGNMQDPVDPAKAQSRYWNGDLYTLCGSGPCMESWMVRDMPIGVETEIHYKFLAANGNSAPAQIGPVTLNHAGGFYRLPGASMPAEKTSLFVGVATLDANLKLQFAPQPQFAAQFAALNKPDPPAGERQ